jgi:7-cyano-7-deazaguanine synthase
MNDAVILLSGGMDSGVLLAWARERYDQMHALYFDYGSKHAAQERLRAVGLARHYGAVLTRIDIPFVNELFSSSLLSSGEEIPEGPYQADSISSTVVPFRNGIMLAIAAGYAENNRIPTVLIASHSGDHPIYPDCRESFTRAMSHAAAEGTFTKVEIQAPFASLDKKGIAELGRMIKFDFTMTFSCYKGGEKHCGLCATCLERKEALRHDEGLDPTEYLA